ncbi:MAG TPA: hypothetical protein VF170_01590 [Planctomycetaceae bacterium]
MRACSLATCLVAAASAFSADLPPLNEAVLRFCEERVGKKVGDGTCAALADEAFREAGAKGPRDGAEADAGVVWGAAVERAEDVKPGDVIQFRDVTLVFRARSGLRYVRYYPQHTAVVARNRGGGWFDVYEQNVVSPGADAERRSRLRKRDVDFRHMVQGTVRFYRPEPR